MTLKLNGTNSVAAPAYAGDDADTGLQCGTNELKLVTGGTARATVDSSGRVGIGTTSAQVDFVVSNGGASGVEIDPGYISGNSLIQAYNRSGSSFDTLGLRAGAISFQIGGSTERIKIDSSGTLKLVNSGGIDFSGIQTNAPGMTSETLDSYEEGTWTPTLSWGGTSATLSSDTYGYYTKIGNICNGSVQNRSNQ